MFGSVSASQKHINKITQQKEAGTLIKCPTTILKTNFQNMRHSFWIECLDCLKLWKEFKYIQSGFKTVLRYLDMKFKTDLRVHLRESQIF
jgi:hypothetical protein